MKKELKVYNSLPRQKELFEPLNPPFVGMYACGPTVYSDPHLGHMRAALTFDIVFRYLKFLGYKVRYVTNITDVGHLENDADEGEDKIAKKAKSEQLEPMEIAQRYTNRYHDSLRALNILRPSIEPLASGHILEQIKMIEKILETGYAYVSNGSVYFDVVKYNEKHNYGKLSGRVLEELIPGGRKLQAQEEKKNSVDFSLWKKASKEHIMRWDSPWGEGFPGWHLECLVMGTKYLGTPFDIHGGGIDLKFPHHECEIAQAIAAHGKDPVKYWMHNNLITIDGQKMSKSIGNFITTFQLFEGDHPMLEQAFSPMTLRFFILQTHYRSPLDFSNEALKAAEKGYKRLINSYETLKKLEYNATDPKIDKKEDEAVTQLCDQCTKQINDDFNTAQVLATLFDLANKINSFKNNQIPLNSISKTTFEKIQKTYADFIEEILGLKAEQEEKDSVTDDLVNLLINIRDEARTNNDFASSDKIRDELSKINIQLKDEKDGSTSWTLID